MDQAPQTPVSDFSEPVSYCCVGGGAGSMGPQKRLRTESTGSALSEPPYPGGRTAPVVAVVPVPQLPTVPTLPTVPALPALPAPAQVTNYPKKRVSVACEVCRSRKTRCDAARPACAFCSQIGAQCVYRTVEAPDEKRALPPAPRGEQHPSQDNTEVLSRLYRIEGLLQQIHSRQDQATTTTTNNNNNNNSTEPRHTDTSFSPSYEHLHRHHVTTPVQHRIGTLSFEGISRFDGCGCPPALLPMAQIGADYDIETEFAQGEALLGADSDNGDEHVDVNDLPSTLNVSPRRCWQLQQIFYRDVLPWCPIIDQQVCSEMVTRTVEARFHPARIDTSLTLFILALGAFAEDQQHLADDARVFPGRDYFRAACALVDSLRQAAFRNTVQYVQCHILMAFYLLYAIRPIQAFEAIRRASEKVVLLLQRRREHWGDNAVYSVVKTAEAEAELCSRSFWACYLIEHELQAYVSYGANLLRDFEETVPLPMSDYDEPGIYWFLSEIALRRIFARQRGGRGWNEHTLFEPVVVGEIALQMAQWHSNLPTPVKFDLDDEGGSGGGVDVVPPLLDPIKVFLRAQYYAIHAALHWQYVVQLLSSPALDTTAYGSHASPAAPMQISMESQRIVDAAALSLRYSVVHVFAVESLLQGRHLLLVPNLVGLLCNLYFLLCSYAEPGLERIQHPRAREAIGVAFRCIQAWGANPVVRTYIEKVAHLMAMKGLSVNRVSMKTDDGK
ncbi:hypothetical protein SCUCBS95973_007335 [Sporothrix curviconia]|uniref:Zn(2)-C6 fungal-type domain-containing protein n=1 Tax=Sporothrix curviconia TaxID=1260050 RepID=A0ABP0CDR3_9PEZI